MSPDVRVNNTFSGELVDNTTYVMTTNITRTTEFSLAFGNTGTGIIWNGNGFKIFATPSTSWNGLFPCTVDIWNLGILSTATTKTDAGWFFQPSRNGSATNCYSTGDIGTGGGGIFGGDGVGTATNCYSSGNIGTRGGGIFGGGAVGTAENCYSTGDIGDDGGGILGRGSGGSAINCYTTGALGTGSGEIFGPNSTVTVLNSGHSAGWNDTDASTYLTGDPTSFPGIGLVWVSEVAGDPFVLNPITACFFGDAPVLTPSGYRRIDSLTIGDTVTTPTGKDVITQIYKRSTVASPRFNPYRIPVGTFGAIEPLLISPRHCIAVNGAMVEARNSGLEQVATEGILTYYNLELEGRSIMIVAGVEVESYVPR